MDDEWIELDREETLRLGDVVRWMVGSEWVVIGPATKRGRGRKGWVSLYSLTKEDVVNDGATPRHRKRRADEQAARPRGAL